MLVSSAYVQRLYSDSKLMQRNLPYVDIDLRIVAASRWQRKTNCIDSMHRKCIEFGCNFKRFYVAAT